MTEYIYGAVRNGKSSKSIKRCIEMIAEREQRRAILERLYAEELNRQTRNYRKVL